MSRVASANGADDALAALFLPFSTAALTLPEDGHVLFLRARAGRWIHDWPHAKFSCEQTFKPFADELARAGMPVMGSSREQATARSQQAVVLVLPPGQRACFLALARRQHE